MSGDNPFNTIPTENLTVEFAGRAAMFVHGAVAGDMEVLEVEILDREALDGSIESLKAVDGYLQSLHQAELDLNTSQGFETVLRCGAYVGEVFRKASQDDYNWMKHSDALARQPLLSKVMGESPNLGTAVLLINGTDLANFPMRKVLKAVKTGTSESVEAFVKEGLSREAHRAYVNEKHAEAEPQKNDGLLRGLFGRKN